MVWVWWLGAALLLAAVEMLSLDLVLIMFAGGALVAGVLAGIGAPLWLQILAFAVTSGALMFALRPWLLTYLRKRVPLEETNTAANVGRTAVVVAEVTRREGLVKLAGEVWSARTEEDSVLAVGAEVLVVRIQGATAIVAPFTRGPRRPQPDQPHLRFDRSNEETAQ